jgi:DNA-binding MarR family transcriptional regulator
MILLVAIETIKRKDSQHQDLASETWTLLQRIAFSQRPRFMSVVREFDLVPPHVIALQALDQPKPMGELAKLLACDSSNVTWITDRLEERGLVERQAAPHDRRVKLLVLTPEGRRVREQIEARLSVPPPLIEALSSEDQRTLRDILRRAAEHLDLPQSSNNA